MFLSTFAPSWNVSGAITEMTPPPAPAAFIASASSVLGEKVLELGSSSIVLKEVFEIVVADSILRSTQHFPQIVWAVAREGTTVGLLPSSFAMLTGRTETSTLPTLATAAGAPASSSVAVGGSVDWAFASADPRRCSTVISSWLHCPLADPRVRRHAAHSPSAWFPPPERLTAGWI